MAATGDPKGFKQDMVVSIRYRNDLPPPPMPPKLLDIDNGGLAQYLTTSFASAMARREEPNIEVDAEGGMPIDMIGIPGYFLGDESAIMAPEIQPVLDPADHALMLTPEQLRNQGSKSSNVSFLRRTQYMTSQNARANEILTRTNPRASKLPPNKGTAGEDSQLPRDDKENIKRHIQKGFDIAYPDSVQAQTKAAPSTTAERDAWRNPVHPDNPRLKPAAYYPLIPDLDTLTELGGFASIKFDKPPMPPLHGRRDDRVDVALLRSLPNKALMQAWQVKKDAYEKNPELYDDPGPEPVIWTYHLPKLEGGTPRLRRIFDDTDPKKDDPSLWDGFYESRPDEQPRIEFSKTRNYPQVTQQPVNSSRFMALSLFNPETAPSRSRLKPQGAAAYYYPIYERMRMKADRGKLGRSTAADEDTDEDDFNGIAVTFTEPDTLIRQARLFQQAGRDDIYSGEYEKVSQLAAEEDEEAQKASKQPSDPGEDVAMRDPSAEASHATNGVNNHHRRDQSVDSDADADAEADPDPMDYE